MRRHPVAVVRAQPYLQMHRQFSFSIITKYEVMRGLKAKSASSQLAAFERLCAVSNVMPLSDEAIVAATEVYADLYRRGELIGDADILIAATAMVNAMTLVSSNERHFRRVIGLRLENWLRE